jgi:hypothetical protein
MKLQAPADYTTARPAADLLGGPRREAAIRPLAQI